MIICTIGSLYSPTLSQDSCRLHQVATKPKRHLLPPLRTLCDQAHDRMHIAALLQMQFVSRGKTHVGDRSECFVSFCRSNIDNPVVAKHQIRLLQGSVHEHHLRWSIVLLREYLMGVLYKY